MTTRQQIIADADTAEQKLADFADAEAFPESLGTAVAFVRIGARLAHKAGLPAPEWQRMCNSMFETLQKGSA